MDVLLHLEPNPTPFHCRWDRFHFECCLLPLKPNLSFSAAVLEDQNRAYTLAILLVRASFIHQKKLALRLSGGTWEDKDLLLLEAGVQQEKHGQHRHGSARRQQMFPWIAQKFLWAVLTTVNREEQLLSLKTVTPALFFKQYSTYRLWNIVQNTWHQHVPISYRKGPS